MVCDRCIALASPAIVFVLALVPMPLLLQFSGNILCSCLGSTSITSSNSFMLLFPLMTMTDARYAVVSPRYSLNEVDSLTTESAFLYQLEHLSLHHAV